MLLLIQSSTHWDAYDCCEYECHYVGLFTTLEEVNAFMKEHKLLPFKNINQTVKQRKNHIRERYWDFTLEELPVNSSKALVHE